MPFAGRTPLEMLADAAAAPKDPQARIQYEDDLLAKRAAERAKAAEEAKAESEQMTSYTPPSLEEIEPCRRVDVGAAGQQGEGVFNPACQPT